MSARRDFDFQYCWTGVNRDGTLCGGYGSTLEEARAHNVNMREFSAGLTPVDVLHSLRVHGHISDDMVLRAMIANSKQGDV